MAKKTPNDLSPNPTVGFRVPRWVFNHYRGLAEKERRTLSQVLRIALEDHAKNRVNGRRQKAA